MRYKNFIFPLFAMFLSLSEGTSVFASEFKDEPLKGCEKQTLKKYRTKQGDSVSTGFTFTDEDTDEHDGEEARLAQFFEDFNHFVCEELLTADQLSQLLEEIHLSTDSYESLKHQRKQRRELVDVQNMVVNLCTTDLLTPAQKRTLGGRNLRMTPSTTPGRKMLYSLNAPIPLYFHGLILRYREIGGASLSVPSVQEPLGENVSHDNYRTDSLSPIIDLPLHFMGHLISSPSSSLGSTDTENSETSTEIDE